jgi:hypothetical protein
LVVLTAALAAAAPRAQYDVDYHVEFLPHDGAAAVTIAIEPHDGHVTRLRLRMDPARYSQVTGDGRVTREGDRVTWEPPEAGGALHYRCKIDHAHAGGRGFDAKIGPRWAIVRGEELVPPARITATRGAESRARLRFTLPKGWTGADTPYQLAKNRSEFVVVDPQHRFDRPAGWIIAGAIGTRRESIEGCRFSVSAPTGERARRNDVIAFANVALPHAHRAFGALPPKLLVVSAGDPMWRGGLSGPRSLFLHADRPLVSENGTSSLMHELFHTITGIRGARADDWIAEGLAEYYAIEIPRRAGLLSPARFERALAWMQRFARGVEHLRGRRADARITARAVLVFAELDREIRDRRAGAASLDDVVRALMPAREVSLAALREAAERASGAPSKALHNPLLEE